MRYTPVQEQPVEVNVEIQCAAEALDQGHRAALRPRAGQPGLLDQMRRDRPVTCGNCESLLGISFGGSLAALQEVVVAALRKKLIRDGARTVWSAAELNQLEPTLLAAVLAGSGRRRSSGDG